MEHAYKRQPEIHSSLSLANFHLHEAGQALPKQGVKTNIVFVHFHVEIFAKQDKPQRIPICMQLTCIYANICLYRNCSVDLGCGGVHKSAQYNMLHGRYTPPRV